MDGDKVSINSIATDIKGQVIYMTHISEKPQFMLDEEYHQQLIECAVEAVKNACKKIYPNNGTSQERLAGMIAMKAKAYILMNGEEHE